MSKTPNYPEFTNEEINDFFNMIESSQIAFNNEQEHSTQSSNNNSHEKPHQNLPLKNNIIIEDDIENSSFIKNLTRREEDKSNQAIEATIDDIISKYSKPNVDSQKKQQENNSDNDNNNNNNCLQSNTKTLINRKRYSEGNSNQAKNKLKRLRKLSQNKELLLDYDATCAICLDKINGLANPDNCSHDFCKDCLIKWSKDCENTCPLCKKNFKKIIIYENNKVVEIKVKKKKQHNDDEFEDEIEYVYYHDDYTYIEGTREDCMKCKVDDDWVNMIVCDDCNVNICHYYCDGLSRIPRGRWSCSDCRERNSQRTRRGRRPKKYFYTEKDFDD